MDLEEVRGEDLEEEMEEETVVDLEEEMEEEMVVDSEEVDLEEAAKAAGSGVGKVVDLEEVRGEDLEEEMEEEMEEAREVDSVEDSVEGSEVEMVVATAVATAVEMEAVKEVDSEAAMVDSVAVKEAACNDILLARVSFSTPLPFSSIPPISFPRPRPRFHLARTISFSRLSCSRSRSHRRRFLHAYASHPR